mmetsp:Transcript_3144/g.6940  ORF Transcript_3144/g.6940 Transcript_3144/m.6940 type:complete len:314 (+) Transcript_3144:143-1084(+)
MRSNNQHRWSMNRERALRWHLMALMLGSAKHQCSAFVLPQPHVPSTSKSTTTTATTTQLFHWANRLDDRFVESDQIVADVTSSQPKLLPLSQQFTRRSLLSIGVAGTTLTTLLSPLVANADFAPGGTLLDREVSIFYGNAEASPSRARDNSNVLFSQDNFYKFGAAAPWIEAGSIEFPKTMPFVLSQQRYDALKKYGTRVTTAMETFTQIGSASSASDVPQHDDPVYQLRALGLLANSFLASENTGMTNELMLERWYINEMYLRIGDYRSALEKGDAKEAKVSYGCLGKAMNSYLSLLNRQITSKVGDKYSYL